MPDVERVLAGAQRRRIGARGSSLGMLARPSTAGSSTARLLQRRDRRQARLCRRRGRLPVGVRAGRSHGPDPVALRPRHGVGSAPIGTRRLGPDRHARRLGPDRLADRRRRVHRDRGLRVAARVAPTRLRPPRPDSAAGPARGPRRGGARAHRRPRRPGRARTGRSPAGRALGPLQPLRPPRASSSAGAPRATDRSGAEPSRAAAVLRADSAPATRWLLHHELRARYRAGSPLPRGRERRNAGLIICRSAWPSAGR